MLAFSRLKSWGEVISLALAEVREAFIRGCDWLDNAGDAGRLVDSPWLRLLSKFGMVLIDQLSGAAGDTASLIVAMRDPAGRSADIRIRSKARTI
mmetsp:Transcript_27987/g.46510  ORF Transcript_27987/g.46510 Transcript_27987/m.46510 type:complete len:95 (+) Transcript_27987:117-401(+)